MKRGRFNGRATAFAVAVSVLGLAAFHPVAGAAAEPTLVALLEFGFLDTSHEPEDQTAEHEARLQLVYQELQQGLKESNDFVFVPLDPDCAPEDSDCIIEAASDAGADLVLAGAIHKGSSMLIEMWAGGFETGAGERVFFRQLSLRGDNDEAWLRGARTIVQELQTELSNSE
ncbi:MAG TPA: DUF2380 domain-containing protein [Kiloniellales bacterium]|nr:DUF2380 domain-containing protein [Kiloniellales bacterium]